ncbi:MAG: glycosyltransferase [Ruminococcaceae bacterium]|nr:glycosyltransferase [Oscillospiraceae bacterium]
MAEFKNLSIMLGAVTEAETLKETVKTVLSICDHKDLKEIIICYSERSTHESMAAVEEIKASETDVPIVVMKQIRPYMASVNDTIDASRGSHCLLLASDMALDLDVVPTLIELAKKEPDVIHSVSRWMKGCKFYGYGRLRRILNFFAQKFLAMLYMKDLTDFTIPVQIAPAELYKSIRFEETRFPFLLEMVLKPIRLGYEFTETPTNCYSRKEGKSSNSILQTMDYLRVALHIRFMKKEDIILDKKE